MVIDKEEFKVDYIEKLQTMFAEEAVDASRLHQYDALGALIKDYCSKSWIETNKEYGKSKTKQVYYFSMEFLVGRLLNSNLVNLGIKDICEEAFADLGISWIDIEDIELDAGLGNGGLGRLAACFLDSMASTKVPGHGCGIRYKYGLFKQKIEDGYQVEVPDNWLKNGNVWEIRKENKAVEVRFYGDVYLKEENGETKVIHENYQSVRAVPYDTPIKGYKNNTVNTLRLWSAETMEEDFDFSSFSQGNYAKAGEEKYSVEAISQVLYPDDSYEKGRLLRLKQEYFFVSAGMQSIMKSYKKMKISLSEFHKHVAIQINDTHPAVAVAELMRLLMDDQGLTWDEAFTITTGTMAYTNHTIMAEALEKWPVEMFKKLLPRIYMIIEEINRRFCNEVYHKYNGDWNKVNKMSIIHDEYIRMAYLAIVGSHSVNGVAKLHTELLKHQELADFYEFFPEKFNNKTNGITHRRWLLNSNKGLANLITETIGDKWIKYPNELNRLMDYAQDAAFQQKTQDIKTNNKITFSNYILSNYGAKIDPSSIFDVHVKRMHAYKRQLLNIFNIMHLYNQLRENPNLDIVPRTFIFGAKASPSYTLAKQGIKLINTLAKKINNDPIARDKIKIVFLENYGVSIAEKIIPCADVSQQISTASKEASGTGNMKFMMNGAITIATLDGANVEIFDAVGKENIVLFGLTSQEVIEYYKNRNYRASDIYNSDMRLNCIVNQLINGFLETDKMEFMTIYDSLIPHNDEFFVLKDFDSYVRAQSEIDSLFRQKAIWQRMAITNIAKSGIFSSDNTINQYAKEIWDTPTFRVKL
ncbi:glycogen/starch/alpha-glucan phosphorylase [Clostridium tagluense]|uniref:glycogen/starch/alpha-glucan phosphorylase n=1 Tax=Clostridium tagluense TaxID=360422 RepID=UPI001C0E7528|nr:glycogen/starch/alpha-glucan phosphorylase [Clostridium tagluense]MBU3127115.1 glycogen/starch/alpha-glucan phosphorylase [Clostridium tagluense]MCB2311983.1 glycogen/starch/alpha-glucan phosphorylase [Clostridium tagluense]MCB2316570.1 glycogen/starch/alpha-glucan phosphorylase [Clostridium tagluense]MCB2321494.1 glycogen/starch/alpha-glucan phosphorylase [Clostridium tagluense]MCB2326506.1 glycogen/starch/alpha-glucan phosphorylase [Clostridium tagluense]